jgi:hypothetical protein
MPMTMPPGKRKRNTTKTSMPVPPRQPYSEQFDGVVLRLADHTLLARQPVPDAETVQQGVFTLRYAIVYLETPQYAIVPGLVAVDYGEMLVGEAAWEFIYKRSNLYPRADVVGYRSDGHDEMIPVKKLDLVQPVMTLVYPTETDTTPLAQIKGVIANDAEGLPAWLTRYAPLYPSVSAFMANQHE